MTENPPFRETGSEAQPVRERPPTFTSWLRNRSDEELTALLTARPDLARPVPADVGALASRATSRNAVLRALEHLDRFTLQVLEAVVGLGDDRLSEPVGVSAEELATALRLAPTVDPGGDPLPRALAHLQELALVWLDRGRLRPVRVLRDLLPRPARLGDPSRPLLAALPHRMVTRLADDLGPHGAGHSPVETVATLLSDPARLNTFLEEVGPRARQLLDSMVWGPPHGTVTDARREVTLATADSPVEELIARALLIPTDEATLTLPREVGLHLRAGALFPEVFIDPPVLEGRQNPVESVSRAAAGQAFTVLRAVEDLVKHWAEDPPAVLRNGGLGVRDLRRAAQVAEVDETTAALFIEVAYAAGLVDIDDRLGGEWLPTREYDLWRESPPEQRWLRLVSAWLVSDRVASLAGSRDSGGRMRNVLGPGMTRPGAPQARRDTLDGLAEAPPGLAPSENSLAALLTWRRPRRASPVHDELVAAALSESSLLGLTALGAPAEHMRLFRDGDTDAAAQLLAEELPRPLDHVLLQGDLTAVAPGPLVTGLAQELALVADVESTGGATVYRFTEASIRRALDAGRGTADITALLENHSRTTIPQALHYLITDTGRRHGRLRAGAVSSYLRCDEPALLEELVGDRRAQDLGLVRLAPTVVASRVGVSTLIERLRQLGYHPVPESGDGSMRLSRPEIRRAEPTSVPTEAPPSVESTRAAVLALRAGDEVATVARRHVPLPEDGPPGSRAMAVLEALSEAARDGRRVWIGYTDTDGRQVSRIVEPSVAEGGFVTAYDTTRGAVHRFAVHRITAVAELAES